MRPLLAGTVRGFRCVRPVLAALGLAVAGLLPAVATAAPSTCPPTAQPMSEAQWQAGQSQSATDRGLLWRIERDGRTSYLYATVHLARRDWVFPGPAVRSALQATEQVALELDLLDEAVMRRLMQVAVRRPETPPLPAELDQRLTRAVGEACLGGGLSGLRPEVQVTTLVSLSLRQEGLDPAWGIDGWLARLAHEQGRPVVSLETPEAQMALMVHDDPAATHAAVQRGLDDMADPKARRVVLRLLDAWEQARLDDLRDYASWCECLETEDDRREHRALIDLRNPPMADRIAELHGRGAVFAAVGALHLVGPAGLPALMTQRGFKVTQVRPQALERP